jgi:hypothetical protein
MGILSIMIHSSVDFNLQIPANTMYFMVLLALAWIALYLDRRPAKPEQVAHTLLLNCSDNGTNFWSACFCKHFSAVS